MIADVNWRLCRATVRLIQRGSKSGMIGPFTTRAFGDSYTPQGTFL